MGMPELGRKLYGMSSWVSADAGWRYSIRWHNLGNSFPAGRRRSPYSGPEIRGRQAAPQRLPEPISRHENAPFRSYNHGYCVIILRTRVRRYAASVIATSTPKWVA